MESQFKVSFIKNTNTFTPSMKKINNIIKTNTNTFTPSMKKINNIMKTNTNTFTPSMKKINNIMKTNMNPLGPYEFYDEIIYDGGELVLEEKGDNNGE